MKLEHRIVEAERVLSATRDEWESISSQLPYESARFHTITSNYLQKGLRNHVNSQIKTAATVQSHWEELLPMLEAIEVPLH